MYSIQFDYSSRHSLQNVSHVHALFHLVLRSLAHFASLLTIITSKGNTKKVQGATLVATTRMMMMILPPPLTHHTMSVIQFVSLEIPYCCGTGFFCTRLSTTFSKNFKSWNADDKMNMLRPLCISVVWKLQLAIIYTRGSSWSSFCGPHGDDDNDDEDNEDDSIYSKDEMVGTRHPTTRAHSLNPFIAVVVNAVMVTAAKPSSSSAMSSIFLHLFSSFF